MTRPADYGEMWRDLVVLEDFTFRPGRQLGPVGEGRGIWVTSDAAPGQQLYLKPTVRDTRPHCGRAAREKICSDLARHAGVLVPPVALAVRRDSGPQEKHVCVSMRMFRMQEDLEATEVWASASSVLSEAIRAHLPSAAAQGYAFDMWVGQTDHRDASPDNIHWGWDPSSEERGFVFLDYAMSLGWKGAWRERGFETDWEVPFPSYLARNIQPDRLEEAVALVERVSDANIGEIVLRIPDPFLAKDERELLAVALRSRRDRLRDKIFSRRGSA